MNLDIEEIMKEQKKKGEVTPTIFDLEVILKAFPKRHCFDVKLTRMQLKWLIKTARRDMGIHLKHPYRDGL